MSAEAYAADLGRKLAADEAWERAIADADEELDGVREEIESVADRLDTRTTHHIRHLADILREQAAVLDGVANTLEGR